MRPRIFYIQLIDIVSERIRYIFLRYLDTQPLRVQFSIVNIIQHFRLYDLSWR